MNKPEKNPPEGHRGGAQPDKAKKNAILKELGGISEAVYDGLVSDFIAQTLRQIGEARVALAGDDRRAAAETLHSIKGCAANLRVKTVLEAAAEAEAGIKKGLSGEEVFRLLDALLAAAGAARE